MFEVRVPELGESIVEATVGRWLKQPGDPVAAGEAVVELETDKVNLEVIAEQGGVLHDILKPTGETVGVGEVLATIAAAGEAAGTAAATPAAAGAAGTKAATPAAPAPDAKAPHETPARAAA
ncbi:biotin/lipoyl-containing protein, partial [Alicyclobacillus cellulosilyticus]|uniref:biotin/lipoyl-containing protein n=1 Tax=Alicyclobacillus cellulosilyticus TaxID=1003997 RepID=UPI0027E4547F